MDILKKVENILQGNYDINDLDYFSVSEQERDIMARVVVNKFFWQLKIDNNSKFYYIDYVNHRIVELLKEDRYEEVDLYKRILKQINLF